MFLHLQDINFLRKNKHNSLVLGKGSKLLQDGILLSALPLKQVHQKITWKSTISERKISYRNMLSLLKVSIPQQFAG